MSARKPDGERVRRAEPIHPWVDLPKSGRPGRPPAVPKWATLTAVAKQWWAWAWKLPEATQWHDAEVASVVRRAELESSWQETGDAKFLAEMRHLENALGMTAKARRDLRWRIVDGETIVEQNGKPADELARRRRRVLDAQAG